MRRILARAKRRSRAFSKVSPSVSLSPFVVELVCAFYFAKGSSSSESPASRYTTPVMPTFSLSVEGECSKRTRKGRANFGEWRFFGVSKKQKLFRCCRRLFLRFFCFFYSVSFSLCLLFYTKACGRQHRISANFFPVSCPYKSWPKSVNFGQLFETLNPKKLAEIG